MPLMNLMGTDSAGTEPSPAIWDRLPMEDVFSGKFKHKFENFYNWGGILDSDVSATVGTYVGDAGHWYSYQDSTDTAAQLATDDNGVLAISIAATDNNESWIQAGSATSVSVTPRTKANNGQSILFEARVNMSTLVGNMFVGLAEEGSAVANFIADANGGLADKDYIGFLVDEDAPTVCRFVYHKASGTAVNLSSSAHTFVADTFVKLGFVVDMDDYNHAQRIKAFVNGVDIGAYGTNTQYENTTDFPTGEELSPIFGGKNNNAAKVVRTDWIRWAQRRSS